MRSALLSSAHTWSYPHKAYTIPSKHTEPRARTTTYRHTDVHKTMHTHDSHAGTANQRAEHSVDATLGTCTGPVEGVGSPCWRVLWRAAWRRRAQTSPCSQTFWSSPGRARAAAWRTPPPSPPRPAPPADPGPACIPGPPLHTARTQHLEPLQRMLFCWAQSCVPIARLESNTIRKLELLRCRQGTFRASSCTARTNLDVRIHMGNRDAAIAQTTRTNELGTFEPASNLAVGCVNSCSPNWIRQPAFAVTIQRLGLYCPTTATNNLPHEASRVR